MEVQLEPLVFIRQPEFWGIEVVGRLPGGIGLPALAPYDVTIPLNGITGTKGIEVIGASRSKKIKVPSTEPEPPGFPEANLFQVRGREDFETLAIETTHLSGFRPRPAKGPQQFYGALSLEGTGSHAD
jgi:hypothetical protein